MLRGFEHVLDPHGQIAVLSANPPLRRTTPDQVLRNRRVRTARRKVWYLAGKGDGIVDSIPPYRLMPGAGNGVG